MSTSSSSSESSELLITAELRAWSSSRTDRSLSDRKQTAGQINHAAVKVLTLKLGPNRLITMRRLLDLSFLVVARAWRSSWRICCLRSCVLARLSCYTNTGLEQIQLIWEHEEPPKAPVCCSEVYLMKPFVCLHLRLLVLDFPLCALRLILFPCCLSFKLPQNPNCKTGHRLRPQGNVVIFHCVDMLHHSPHVRCDFSILC